MPEGAIARIGSPRLRHAGEVAAMAFSTDGRWLASASPDDHDRTVRVWDLADGAEKRRVPIEVNANESSVMQRTVAVGFSRDDRQLRVIDFNSYRVIDRATGRQVLQHRFHEKAPPPGRMDPSHVIGATFSADMSTYAAIRRNGDLILGDAATGKIRRVIAQVFVVQQNQFYSYVSVILSGDGRRVCVPLYSDPTKIIDTATGKVIRILSLKQQGNWDSAFLKGGDEFAYLAHDGAKPIVQVVNVADGKKVRQIPVEMSAICLDFSPDGKLLAVGNTQRFCIQMFDLLTGKEIRRIPRSPSESRLVFSPDSKRLASVSYYSGRVTVWDTATGKRLSSSADGVEYTRGFDREGRLVVGVDGRNRITDWKTGRVFGDLP
ncbi:MAG: WD40 repeat domain-containing protein, partial [Pirellulales bacterium]